MCIGISGKSKESSPHMISIPKRSAQYMRIEERHLFAMGALVLERQFAVGGLHVLFGERADLNPIFYEVTAPQRKATKTIQSRRKATKE